MVGCGEHAMYLTSPGSPADIGLQLSKAYYLGKDRGRMLLFLLFLYFHSCSFFPVLLFYLLYYFFCLFSPFLWEMTQNDPQELTCRLTPTESKIRVSTVCKQFSLSYAPSLEIWRAYCFGLVFPFVHTSCFSCKQNV